MEENKKPQAYPTLFYNQTTGEPNGHDAGMTLRDKFAETAMLGILNNGITIRDVNKTIEAYRVIAYNAYLLADAMLKQREL